MLLKHRVLGDCSLCGFLVSENDTHTGLAHNLCLRAKAAGLDVAALVAKAKGYSPSNLKSTGEGGVE